MTETPVDSSKKLFVIDQSSSMEGQPYEEVKAAVRYILEQTSTDQPDFILYNNSAQFATAEEVLSSHTGGGTSFEAACGKIQEYIAKQPAGSTVRTVG
eukprot:COSAG04_NODE_3816_length_2500_cov_9.281549_1_plen_98_part_00